MKLPNDSYSELYFPVSMSSYVNRNLESPELCFRAKLIQTLSGVQEPQQCAPRTLPSLETTIAGRRMAKTPKILPSVSSLLRIYNVIECSSVVRLEPSQHVHRSD